jgi:hypothetical protein
MVYAEHGPLLRGLPCALEPLRCGRHPHLHLDDLRSPVTFVRTHNRRRLHMPPRLTEPIKREIELDGHPYTITIGPSGIHIAPKGKRKGHELSWRSLVSGEAELNRDLVRSLAAKVATKTVKK